MGVERLHGEWPLGGHWSVAYAHCTSYYIFLIAATPLVQGDRGLQVLHDEVRCDRNKVPGRAVIQDTLQRCATRQRFCGGPSRRPTPTGSPRPHPRGSDRSIRALVIRSNLAFPAFPSPCHGAASCDASIGCSMRAEFAVGSATKSITRTFCLRGDSGARAFLRHSNGRRRRL